MKPALRLIALLLAFVSVTVPALAQGTEADYARAESLRTRLYGLVEGSVDEPAFSEDSKTLIYRRTLKGGGIEFVQVDLTTMTKSAAFDQAAVAKALSDATGRPWKGRHLPFPNYKLAADRTSMEFEANDAKWRCLFDGWSCEKLEDVNRPPPILEGGICLSEKMRNVRFSATSGPPASRRPRTGRKNL